MKNKKLIIFTKNIFLLTISSFLCLIIAEAVIRKLNLGPALIDHLGPFRLVDNPKLVYELIPYARIDGSVLNKQGFKDSDFVEAKDGRLIRVAMLGDSITMGMGIPYGETFSDKLESMLNQEALLQGNNFKYEVMNFGVSGYNLEAEVETLKNKVVQFRPDIVILNLNLNDNEPFAGLYMWFMHENGLTDKQKYLILKKYCSQNNSFGRLVKRKILYKSKLYLFLMDRLANLHKITKELLRFTKENHCIILKDVETKKMYGYFYQIKQLKKKYNFDFLACLHDSINPHSDMDINIKKFSNILNETGFPFFYMKSYYNNVSQSPDVFVLFPGDFSHPNELGHSVIAKAMFTELKKSNFIDLK